MDIATTFIIANISITDFIDVIFVTKTMIDIILERFKKI